MVKVREAPASPGIEGTLAAVKGAASGDFEGDQPPQGIEEEPSEKELF